MPQLDLFLYFLHFCIFSREKIIGGLFKKDNTMSDLSFDVLLGKFGCVTAALCHLFVLGHRLGIAVT